MQACVRLLPAEADCTHLRFAGISEWPFMPLRRLLNGMNGMLFMVKHLLKHLNVLLFLLEHLLVLLTALLCLLNKAAVLFGGILCG